MSEDERLPHGMSMTDHTQGKLTNVHRIIDGKPMLDLYLPSETETMPEHYVGTITGCSNDFLNQIILRWNACDGLTDWQLADLINLGGFAEMTIGKAETAAEAILLVAMGLRDDTIARLESEKAQMLKALEGAEDLRVWQKCADLADSTGDKVSAREYTIKILEAESAITAAIKVATEERRTA